MLLLFVGLSFGLSHLSANNVERGKQFYATCTACHGLKGEGNTVLKAPALAGQEDWYLKSQLLKFKNDIRGAHPKDLEGKQMAPMAKILPDDAVMDDVISYIKTFPMVKPTPSLKGDPVKGKQHYLTCTACHGPKANGMKVLKAPALKQLPDWYLLTQLKKFKEGIRGAHPKDLEGMQMAPMSKLLADEQAMKDVITYIHSLK
jgi:cytochrome c oxidase subunit 2